MLPTIILVTLLVASNAFTFSPASSRSSALRMSVKSGKGAGFNYDPSNFKDSNSGNYRRLSDQLAAAKAEDEQLQKEREEILRKEAMAAMLLKQENSTFWDTPGNQIVATSDQFFVNPEVLQIISDLDNQLIGLQPVSFRAIVFLDSSAESNSD